jgi:hypothetical protein
MKALPNSPARRLSFIRTSRGTRPPAQQPTTADPEAIFCEKSSFSFCKEKTQQGPMGERLPSFRDAIRQSAQRRFAEGWAYDCHRRRLTPEQCATAVLQGAE